ncbi:cytochrome P450 315a1, mitochondrial [Cataglyphis hispanica]|uniref:cytochrome P450 315a1, mitochondrial n=1 Tax=Cataglyphis hispanica TaxID=1086592 RepID=UPI00217FF876|nr:cytochrome P450 315a1, mitochondrial [Cataglyphis hispanica]XP_050457808.1 cytochrome P450 315a1, mitochondrial [Cataglyphis hispanica]
MHWMVRRISRRISRSVNHCGEFNVSFSKECGTLGCDPRSFVLNEKDITRSSRNVIDQNATRMLSQTFQRDCSTFAKKTPPEPRRVPFFGTMLSLMMAGGAQKLHEYVDRRHRKLGPVFKEQIGPLWIVFVNSPDEFRKIFLRLEGPTPQHFIPEAWRLYNEIRAQRRGLIFMDGDEWLHFRRILNKTMLLPNPTKFMCAPCQEIAENLARKWMCYSLAGSAIPNMECQLYQWSIEVMLATLIGSRWRDCEQHLRPEAEHLALMLHQIFVYSSTLSMMPAKLAMRLRLPAWTKFVRTADEILVTVRNLVLKMIFLESDGLLRMMINDGIGNDDAIRIVTDFIIAAGDTTAISMQWALLLLSDRPELQDQLFHDIKDLPPEEILRHPLLKGVWKEALRLHPVAPFLSRYMLADNTIGDYFVAKGDLVVLSIYSSGRDGNDFPEPNEFRPERWIRTKDGSYQGVKNLYATLPFAMGVRSCIGRKLAETQMSLTLAQLIKNFKIECENRDSIKMILHLISVPSKPIQLKLTERKL